MGKHKIKVTGFRIKDETILEKMGVIAENNCLTGNQKVEYALKKYVEEYEKSNGSISVQNIQNNEAVNIISGQTDNINSISIGK